MVDDKIKKLVALLEKMPKTDRGYSWELRDAYGNEAIRAYGANAAAFKFILDHTDELIAALSEAEKREREARSPFEIVADWHDRQARTFKEMSHDWRSGEQVRKKAADAAKHHAGSAAALRLHAINERRAALERSEG
ncbi:hypothetical protein [Agrobacterium pusense]|uniref:hypothetical protein n=1 Tax=Agrobacterium pusense TaxID=648995 RepID=UPI00244A8721|nr:hypothetical protein [Agrobacterium pusense]MDH0869705.1 hypothetical protein [Agrobacterium pusense]